MSYDIPQIRFKGFTDAWEQRKLNSIATMKARIGWQGLTKKEFLDEGDYCLITGTDFDNGMIDFRNCHFIGEDRYRQDVNIQIKVGDVLITKDGTIGKVAYIETLGKPATLNAGVFVIRGRDESISNLYLYHYLAAPFLLDYADKQATGGTIKHLNQNVLVSFPVPLPPVVAEQEQIGQFFSVLNSLITLHKRKLDSLNQLKMGYLQQMFPQTGENVPRMRFVEFTDDWNEKILNTIVRITKGEQKGRQEISQIQTDENPIPVFNGGKLPSGYTNISNRIGKVMISEGGNSCGFINYYEGKFWSGGHNYTLDEKELHIFYLKYILEFNQEQLYSLRVGSGLPNIQKHALENFMVTVPEFQEQISIGAILHNLDEQITIQKTKLDKLKQLKAAYLQKMFV